LCLIGHRRDFNYRICESTIAASRRKVFARTPVARLLGVRRPATIPRLIAQIVVTAIQRHTRWARPKFGVELLERREPEPDTATTVVGKVCPVRSIRLDICSLCFRFEFGVAVVNQTVILSELKDTRPLQDSKTPLQFMDGRRRNPLCRLVVNKPFDIGSERADCVGRLALARLEAGSF